MKHSWILFLIYMLAVGILAGAEERPAAELSSQPTRHVVTALDHLTVLDYDEPVAQAAAGSSAFQIERQDNKVFIKPLKPGVSTNLFVWTASNHTFSYELSVGEITNMNAEIHIAVPRLTPVPDTSAQIEQLADVLVTRTLLGVKSIDSTGIKTPRNKIGLRIEQVFRSRTSIYIQYSIENLSPSAYRITTPNLYALQFERPHASLIPLKGRQLDRQLLNELGKSKEAALSIAHADTETEDIAPGTRKHGIIAVRQSEQTDPVVLRLVFDGNVAATMVL